MELSSKGIFESLLEHEPLFVDREVLRPSFTPEQLPHRDEQINQLARILVAALRGETPSNIIIYGKPGTGKTAVVKYLGQELRESATDLSHKWADNAVHLFLPEVSGTRLDSVPPGVSAEELFGTDVADEIERPVTFVYINCEQVDTQYRVLTRLANEFIDDWGNRIPFTGWPTDEVYSRLLDRIDAAGGATIIVLDEIDKLVKKSGDDVLYNLTRVNADLSQAKVSVIGISNDLNFIDYLDPRVKSSLGEDEIIFPPYKAEQLQDILRQRAEMAFRDDTLNTGVIPLCAALAAQEHGDARRALDLLRVSAEIAERAEKDEVKEEDVRRAQDKIELDRIREVIRDLPTQSKLVLLGTLVHDGSRNGGLTTGEVYDVYQQLADRAGTDSLTQRRVTDLISELDMLGILNARVISKGRYGRTKEIKLSVPYEYAKKVLRRDEMIGDLVEYTPRQMQTRLDADGNGSGNGGGFGDGA